MCAALVHSKFCLTQKYAKVLRRWTFIFFTTCLILSSLNQLLKYLKLSQIHLIFLKLQSVTHIQPAPSHIQTKKNHQPAYPLLHWQIPGPLPLLKTTSL